MLRLPRYRYHRPRALAEAVELLARHEDALPIAGGTDLVPNMKHRLWTPGHLVALGGLAELAGITARSDDDQPVAWDDPAARWIAIGAVTTLHTVATHPAIGHRLPALARAAGLVAGPQLRHRGTLGGNLCLDTRCTYYNQTAFWRHALGYCLKKDGTVCHVTKVGRKCVAAHSADTPPVLWTLDAVVDLVGPEGERTVPVRDFFVADGSWNTVRRREEIVRRIRVPVRAIARAQGYAKLRLRKAIDFPLLSVAVAATLEGERVAELRLVVSALGARPREVTGLERAAGLPLPEAAELAAELAWRQCHPLENIPVDPEWRRAMVPVFVRRAMTQLRAN